MSKYLIIPALFACSLIPLKSNGQSSQEQVDSVFKKVRIFFDLKQPDSLYALTGEAFRSKLSPEAFKQVSVGLFQVGKILDAQLMSHKGGVSSYKLSTKDVTLEMLLGLDSSGRIHTFLFRPWKDLTALKATPVATSNRMSSPLDHTVDSLVRKYIQLEPAAGLSVGIYKDRKSGFYHYGTIAKGREILPDDSTFYEIGSITKTFTSLILAHLVNEGKLALKDPIVKYLPDSVAENEALKNISVVMLANHTSGLQRMPGNFLVVVKDALNPYKDYPVEAMMAYLKKAKLENEPGKSFSYSNLGMAVLGYILEKAGGSDYQNLFERYITGPLSLKNTTLSLDSAQKTRMTRVYNENGEETPAWDFQVMAPAGAVRSNVADMVNYGVSMLDPSRGESFEKARQLVLTKSHDGLAKIGLGWMILEKDGVTIYTHSGGTYGSRSFLAIVPDKKIVVTLLSNSALDVDETGAHLLFSLLGIQSGE